MKISTRIQILLLVLMALAAYYPVIFAGYNPVDDQTLISTWMERGWGDLWDYFFRQGGYHYRPLVGVSFFLDNLFWGLEPGFMHLENVLLHLSSSLLVYAISVRLFRLCGWSTGLYPLAASLLFVLHPVNTEAVSWISGRFDLLAGFLVLSSLYVLLSGEPAGKLLRVFLSSALFFLACLAKESAIFFYGGAFLLIFFLKRRTVENNARAVLASLPGWLAWSGTTALYFACRHFALSGHDTGIGAVTGTAAKADNAFEVFDKIRITFKVMGFYVKKLFVPHPLNYAIINVSDYYVVLGAVLFLLVFYLIWRVWRVNDAGAIMALSALGMTLAGLIVALGKMAWTPVAERYLYMPSFFFVLAVTLCCRVVLSRYQAGPVFRPAVCLLFVMIAMLTFQRSYVWSDPVRFLEDTVQKSPEFYPVRSDLAYLYSLRGDVDKARAMLGDISEEVGHLPYVNADLNQAKILVREGDYEQARQILQARLENSGKRFKDVANGLIQVNNRYMASTADEALLLELKEDNLRLLQRLNEKANDPFLTYRLARAYMVLDYPQEACKYYREAYEKAPVDAYYRNPAGKLAEKLCTE